MRARIRDACEKEGRSYSLDVTIENHRERDNSQHVCVAKRYDSEVPEYVLIQAAQKFYANLITPLSALVLKKMDEIGKLVRSIKLIAPSHGKIWTDPAKIIHAYADWATGKAKNKAMILSDTMHYSTQKMARALAEGLIAGGVDVAMYFLLPTKGAR